MEYSPIYILDTTMTKSSNKADRPVLKDEVEVTPEMLAAGVKVYVESDLRFESVESLVLDIYKAMSLLRESRRG